MASYPKLFFMPTHRHLLFFILLLAGSGRAFGQKPFAEGTIVYKVKLVTPGQKDIVGSYIFEIKGTQVKKELKLSNGYQDVVLINCTAGTVYSLQTSNNRKYAIQLKMDNLVQRQDAFAHFNVKNEVLNVKNIAGFASCKGDVVYRDGTQAETYYTKDWYPAQSITYERYPDAKFLPLYFFYKDEQGISMEFEAKKIEPMPIPDAVFRIPSDYKMISYEEYKQLSK